MKILKITLLLMASMLFLIGCNEPHTPAPGVAGTIADFFPFHENTVVVFEDTGPWGNSVFYTIQVDGNRMQRRITMGQFTVAEVLEIYDGELRVNHARHFASGFEPLIDQKDETPMVILKEPLVVGNSWETHTGPTIQGVARGQATITAVDVEVETPYGLVTAIEVSTEFENGYTVVDYFARGLGLVQSGYFIQGFERDLGDTRFIQEEMTVHLSLLSITENTPLSVDVFVVHPNDEGNDLDYTEVSFEFMTGGSITEAFEALLRDPADGLTGLISPHTVINSIDISWRPSEANPQFDETIVHVDLSEDFVLDLNAGALAEQLLLISLEATFTEFFSAHEFVLTIDGQPYVSRH